MKGDIRDESEIMQLLVTNVSNLIISLSHIGTKLRAINLSIAKLQCRVCQKKSHYPHVFTHVCRHMYYVAPLIDIRAMYLENTSWICTVFATGFSIYRYSGNYPRSMKRLSLSKSGICECIHANSTLLA